MSTDLSILNADHFRPAVGHPVTLTAPDRMPVEGRLVAVRDYPERARPSGNGRVPFSLYLVSPEMNADPDGLVGILAIEGLEPVAGIYANPIIGDPRPEWGTGRLWQITFN
jgi:hypothetical protein